MKRIKTDDSYKDEVRKSPEDVKAYKDIKGKEIQKGKLGREYLRKYKNESEQFEAWINSQIDGLNILIEDDDIDVSEYHDAFAKTQLSENQDHGYVKMIIQQNPEEYKKFLETGDLMDAPTVYEKLFAYFSSSDASDQMPYGTMKARDGDPYVWLADKLNDLGLAEDDMSTGTVAVGKKGKTRRATGINDNPYDHNEGEDQTALVNAALWNMKDVYQTIMAGEDIAEDDMFSYGDLVQYLEQADMPDHYSKFWELVTDAINSAGGFKGQGDAIGVDKNIAPKIKTLYQQFKADTAKLKGVKEAPTKKSEQESHELGDIIRLSGLK